MTIGRAFLMSVVLLLEPVYSQDRIVVSASVSGVDHPIYRVAVRILPEAYKMIGCDMELKIVPALRAIALFDNERVDGFIFSDTLFTKKHPNSIIVPIPLGYDEFVVYTVKTKFIPDGWGSLRPYSIGYLKGMLVVENNLVGMNTDGAENRDQIFTKLVAGRTDVAVLPRYISSTLKNKYPEVTYLMPPLAKTPLYTYLTAKNRTLAPRLAGALSTLRTKGRIKEVTDQVLAEMHAE